MNYLDLVDPKDPVRYTYVIKQIFYVIAFLNWDE
jgi:hypothetical protein